MLKLISIHIPRTGGTSFYQILREIYGAKTSISYRRKDYLEAIENSQSFSKFISENIETLHGHFFYKEIETLHQTSQAKLICWLRNPVERVISNHRHFIHRNSGQNPIRPNQHRVNESLLDYARQEQNGNRVSQFLEGLEPEDFFFIGLLEFFEEDLAQLAKLLEWPTFSIPKLNTVKPIYPSIRNDVFQEIKEFNGDDMDWYERAIELRESRNNKYQKSS